MAREPVEIGVLGALEVRRAGAPAPLPGGRPRAALAALAVQAPRPLSVDGIVAAVWGADEPARPRGAVHTVVSRLRSVLGGEAVRAGPAGYRLALPVEAVDAGRFEALRRRAAGLPPPQAAQVLDEALALWRGPAYAEFADDDFAAAEAARLEELRLRTVEDRAVLALRAGAVDDAVSALEDLVAEQPLREHAHELLMTALYRAGRAAEALDRFSGLRRTLADELGLDPSPALRDLHVRILGHDLPPDPAPPQDRPAPSAWPPAPGAFVGRGDDTGRLLGAVSAHRLVCVTGPGGVGKTRLVAEVLPELSRRLARPAVVVELEDAAPAQVDARVAAALGLGAAAELRSAVLEYLTASSLVLLLDGCDLVLDEVRELADAVGRTAPRVHVLVTSRRRMDLPAEQVQPLAPLALPDPADDPDRIASTDSVRLFLDRMRRVRPAVRLSEPALCDIGELCRRLDGVPLALELAATQAAVLGVRPVLEDIGAGLQLDDGTHGPLRAVVARSYDLLDPSDRALLGRLSAFTGTFDLAAAEHVAQVRPARPGLARLVQASLVLPVDDGAGTRYRLLGTVRAVAAESADTDAAAAFRRWAAAHAEQCAREATGPRCGTALRGLELARADLASAVAGALAAGHLEQAARVVGFLGLCVHWVPGPVLSDLALRVGEHPDLEGTASAALALGAAALAADERGELERAEELGSLAIRAASTPAERYLALASLGIAAVYAGDRGTAVRRWGEVLRIPGLPDAYRVDAHAVLALARAAAGAVRGEAEAHAAAARRAAERSGAASRVAFALYASAEVLLPTDPEAAADVLREAARLADGVRAEQVAAVSRVALLSVLTRTGQAPEALDLALALLELQRRRGHWPQLWTTLRILAELFAAAGRLDAAQLVLTAAEAAESAPGVAGADVERYRSVREAVRDGLGGDRAHRIATLARLLPRTEILDRARATAEELTARRLLRPVSGAP